MAAKKLSIKKKKGKLVVHKAGSVDNKDKESKELSATEDTSDTKLQGSVAVNQAVATTSVKEGHGETSTHTEEIDTEDVGINPALIMVSKSRTINLAEYESLKIGVSITVPSKVSEDEIEGNYAFANEWVDNKLQENIDEYVDDE